MDYNVQVEEIAAQPLAVAQGWSPADNVVPVMMSLLGKVWPVVKGNNIPNNGLNTVVYHSLPDRPGELFIEAGVGVTEDFQSQGELVASSLPVGRAATAVHMGAYNKLGEAHRAVRDWCRAQGHELEGTSWEIYGHWTPNEDEQRTDVYYLLK